MHTLDRYDGLHSALIGILNGGVSGFGLGHSDIGGYTTVNDEFFKITRDEETLLRWIEMNTFSDAIFRTHPSSQPAVNVQVWDNTKIAQFFGKFAALFASLGEYRMLMMIETE